VKIWNYEPVNPWNRESVKIWSCEPANIWNHEPAKIWSHEPAKFGNLVKFKFWGYDVWRFPCTRDSETSKKPSQRRCLKSSGLTCELVAGCKCMKSAPQIMGCKRHLCTCSH
jgi:hypothetical protein